MDSTVLMRTADIQSALITQKQSAIRPHTSAFLLVALVLLGATSSGCLVLSLRPVYDADSIDWEPGLVGTWYDADDRVTLTFDAAEWRSYRLHYDHPSERGDLTAYMTLLGDDHYLDVGPLRGEDHGSFLLPVHGVLRVTLDGDTLTLTPLSYDWFSARMKSRQPIGIAAVFDQKQNALITAPTPRLRAWLRGLPATSSAWGAEASFSRTKPRN